MAFAGLVLIAAVFGAMAAFFGWQARVERRRLGALARATLTRDAALPGVVAWIDDQLPGPTDPVEIARVLQAA